MKIALMALALAAPAAAQVASEDFSTGNTDEWGVEFGAAAPHQTTGGNPGGRIAADIRNANSILPAAMLVPARAGHPWQGNFRSLGVSEFRFDRQVEMGSSNFGTRPYLVLGNDGGTPNSFMDDAWVFVATGDNFQFGTSPWTTISVPIPSLMTATSASWRTAALPMSTLAGLTDDEIWNGVMTDVGYVGIAMEAPAGSAGWFGQHIISFDNFVLEAGGGIGSSYCDPANTNSTGSSAEITAAGSAIASQNNLILFASALPQSSFGYFLTSTTSGFTPNPNNSSGDLCLGGSIGRYVGAGQIQNSGSTGVISLALNLTQTPTPTGLVSVAAGETWHFQAWFRDSVNGVLTSNFTDGLEVVFQ